MSETITLGRRWYMRSVGTLVWFALLLQLYVTLHLSQENGQSVLIGIGIYLRYFTVLTNILVAFALTAPLWTQQSRIGRFFARPDVNAAIATYIIIVGLTYSILLRATWNPTGLQLVADRLLHDAMPLLFVFYWLMFIPRGYLRWPQVIPWMLYPLAYFIYALLIGASTGVYAYPFIDVAILGYPRVFANSVGLLVGFVIVTELMVAIDRWMTRRA